VYNESVLCEFTHFTVKWRHLVNRLPFDNALKLQHNGVGRRLVHIRLGKVSFVLVEHGAKVNSLTLRFLAKGYCQTSVDAAVKIGRCAARRRAISRRQKP